MTFHRLLRPLVASFVVALAIPPGAGAQSRLNLPTLPTTSPLMGGVPTGTATTEPIPVSIVQAIRQTLQHNLGLLQAEEGVVRATGAHSLALSGLRPDVSVSVIESRRETNLEAFGFPLDRFSFGGTIPTVVGPFNVFDARAFVKQTVLDLEAVNKAHAESHQLTAARYSYRGAREAVVLLTASLYLRGLAAEARATTARAQLETADALRAQAEDLRKSGIVAGIDVVRAEVRVSTDRQRATAAQAEFEKTKLQLARVMGLPIGQPITLSDQIPPVPVPDLTIEQALERAYNERPEYLAAKARLDAAEASRKAALAESLPSVSVIGDYGVIGLTLPTARSTFAVTGTVNVPIFDGGKARAHVQRATADRNDRQREYEDLRGQIYYEVRSAFLDLQATSEELQAATRGRDLSTLQLTQARDRFAAGVANNIEVIQAQEAVALANELYIDAQFGYSVSKAVLGHALGRIEEAVEKFFGGVK